MGDENRSIVTISLNCPAAFSYDDESRSTAGSRWPVWIRVFELFADGSGITDAQQKKAILLHVVGRAAREIYFTLKKDTDDYNAVVKVFKDYFAPLKNVDYEIFNFGLMRQRESESVDDFIVRLRVAADKCEFKDVDGEIKKMVIAGCKSIRLKELILGQAGITLTDIQTKARAIEAVNSQAKAIDSFSVKKEPVVKTEPVCAVQGSFKANNKRVSFSGGGKSPRAKDGKGAERKCFACGYDFPHSGDCPAKGKKCKTCKEGGHFASSKYCKKRVNVVKSEASEEYEDRAYLFANRGGTLPLLYFTQ